jgi:hypothetical protein
MTETKENLLNEESKAALDLDYKYRWLADQFYDIREVADIMHTSDISIRRLLKRGDLEGRRPLAGKILIPRQSIIDFLEKIEREAKTKGITDHRFAPYSKNPKKKAA